MKTILISIFSGALMAALGFAQQTAQPNPSQMPQAQNTQTEPATANQAQSSTKIAPGSVIPVSLTKTIDAKKAKNGDEVVAKVTQDMKAATGEVLVPRDTKVVGHVTAAQPRSKEQKESEVAIAFDRAIMKNGSELQMPMSIQAIIGSYNASSGNPNTNATGDSATASAAGASPSGSNGRPGGMGGAPSQATPPSMPTSTDNSSTQTTKQPPITAKTEGVIGIPNLALTAAAPNAHGSLVTSEKDNVKLESGTLMLLRVNQ
jgi:hypothetical protein